MIDLIFFAKKLQLNYFFFNAIVYDSGENSVTFFTALQWDRDK